MVVHWDKKIDSEKQDILKKKVLISNLTLH